MLIRLGVGGLGFTTDSTVLVNRMRQDSIGVRYRYNLKVNFTLNPPQLAIFAALFSAFEPCGYPFLLM